jgi:hypothetical protein
MINQVDSDGKSVAGALVFPFAEMLQKILDEMHPDNATINSFASKQMAAAGLGVNEKTGEKKK